MSLLKIKSRSKKRISRLGRSREKNSKNSGPKKEVITNSVLPQKSELQRKMLRLSIKRSAKE